MFWARYLNETIELFGAHRADVFLRRLITGRSGAPPRAIDFLRKQRDLYGYLHDQTLRLINKGLHGSHPAHLREHPPVERARRYVEAIGGIDAMWTRP